MAARKKSNFYHVRFNKVGISEIEASKILGVDIEQIALWDKEGAPIYVERLLLLWDRKNVNVEGWSGWMFTRGVLKYKKEQFRPENILEARMILNENYALKTALERLYSWEGILRIGRCLLSTKFVDKGVNEWPETSVKRGIQLD